MRAARRRPLIAAGLALIALAACRGDDHRVDVCGRGDRGDLTTALASGRLELRFVDGDGSIMATASAEVEEPSDLDLAVPEGTARVEVTGFDSTGTEVARGSGAVSGGSACVCLALDPQHLAVCEGVACKVEAGSCEFFDEVTGERADRRTIVIGDNPGDDFSGATFDTTLSAIDGDHDLNFGGAERLRASAAPVTTTMVRFDMSRLPRDIVIESAELELSPCTAADCRVAGAAAVFRVIEPWTEGELDGAAACASWNCRQSGVAWSVPGCGYLSERDRSRDGAASAQTALAAGAPARFDVTELVARWIDEPDDNFGVALAVDEDGAADFASSEAPATLGDRPRLRVTFRLTETPGDRDAGPDDPPDGGPLPDASGSEMIAISAGGFLMGCDPTKDDSCRPNSLPLHAVTVSAYEIDRTEVTQEAYAECVDAGTCPAPSCDWDPVGRASYPVTCVRWSWARDYCAFVGKRLPTEAEWEKAARGTDGRIFPWGDDPPDCSFANAFGCVGATQPVGLRQAGASPYGALDMSGNAAEYVADWYKGDYYETSPESDPTGPATGGRRVRRGGSYSGSEVFITTYFRGRNLPTDELPSLGFRCAR